MKEQIRKIIEQIRVEKQNRQSNSIEEKSRKEKRRKQNRVEQIRGDLSII